MELFKKITRISFWVLVVAGLVTVFAFAQKKENETLCSRLNISVLRNPVEENFLVNEDDIRKLIAQRFGQVENAPLKNIDVNSLEQLVYSNPWVLRANVYAALNGVVNIEIEQRKPVLRVINRQGESYYIDFNGKLMPWSPGFTPRTPVATGNIGERYSEWCRTDLNEINNDTLKTRTVLDDLYAMARFILADEFWSAHVEQLYVNRQGEIELVPEVGDNKIIFGSSDRMEDKFWKLKTFYKEGLNYTGWDNYDTLNLKFENQVVCTKKIPRLLSGQKFKIQKSKTEAAH